MGIILKSWQTSSSKKKRTLRGVEGRSIDGYLLLSVFFLLGIGLVQVYSSSFVYATDKFGDGLFFFKKQTLFAVAGFTTLLIVATLSQKWVQVLGVVLFFASLILMFGTLVPGFGVTVGGATRWIQLPFGFRLEPAEFFKVGWPFFISFGLVKGWKYWGLIRRSFFTLILVAPYIVFYQQPDFGSLVLATSVVVALLFVNGLSWKFLFAGSALVASSLALLIYSAEYRMKRVESFLDPWADASGAGFQTIQSMLGFYSGGFFGKGLGSGQSKLHFLPEAHTDFTLSVLGEELGFIGTGFLLVFIGFVIFRSFWIASRVENERKRLTGIGLVTLFALQVFINFSVALGLLPTKGLTLPFLSYGGSSLLSTCLLFGIILNFSKEPRLK